MTDVLIIGGGAAGFAAAITAARRGKIVRVIESADRAGKKILASGNGKCNLAAREGVETAYNTPYAAAIIHAVGERRIEEFFLSLGLPLRCESGRVYPYSELSSSVLGVLRREAERLGVEFEYGTAVERIEPVDGNFRVGGERAKKIIVATGSHATFGRDSLALARVLGLETKQFRPALVPVLCEPSEIRGLKGVRMKGEAVLYSRGEEVARERGEILFKDNGLSGIAIFNLSSRIARDGRGGEIGLDLFPDYSIEELTRFLNDYGFEGVCHKELARNVVSRVGDDPRAQARTLKSYRVGVRSLGSPELAQVMSGGVSVSELDADCQATRFPGLYFAGEIVDVDGLCGGYNLLWAWASGIRAGESV